MRFTPGGRGYFAEMARTQAGLDEVIATAGKYGVSFLLEAQAAAA